MKPFFSYYGGKWRASGHLPEPLIDTIVEPFAGSAGYSVRYNARRVILIDKSPIVAGVWRYLINVSEAEILALPDVREGEDVRDLPLIPEARNLIGFWLNKGNKSPCNVPSAWMRKGTHANSFWGAAIRERIARQLTSIRHWQIVEGSYVDAPDVRATWIVDPPYQIAGAHYLEPASAIDFADLAAWSRARPGVAFVHENDGADWLPFEPWLVVKASPGRSRSRTSAEALACFVDGEQVFL